MLGDDAADAPRQRGDVLLLGQAATVSSLQGIGNRARMRIRLVRTSTTLTGLRTRPALR